MHSGTDSQYERINPDILSRRKKESIIIEEDSLTDISDDSLLEENYTYQMEYPQEEHNYPRREPEEGPWRFSNTREDYIPEEGSSYPEEERKNPNKNNLTSIQKRYTQEGDEPLIETC